MEETDRGVAKDLFVKHYGSAIQMHREGVYAEYKRWDVPQELEEQWIGERIWTYVKKVDTTLRICP
ncbi:Na+-transporting NADH:ubiquinone oxidoreductase subunit NqrF [Paenibacillus sp. W4I10]|nr:Na+-transporting NADH:ubiquinone oxidoreductase subunit NqrF [Paenibacillus sp. W4I10]